jgi:hypothetical protein
MPRRTDLQSILILGSGPIVIGQAAEFDYSGTQGAVIAGCRVPRRDAPRPSSIARMACIHGDAAMITSHRPSPALLVRVQGDQEGLDGSAGAPTACTAKPVGAPPAGCDQAIRYSTPSRAIMPRRATAAVPPMEKSR